jgi:ABC-2 type transport system permease protein
LPSAATPLPVRNMKKYFTVFTQSFSQFVAYRFNVFTQIIQSFITPVFIMAALYAASPIGDISAKNLISYYILISLISPITVSNIDEDLDELTSTGDINNFLTKPFSVFNWLYAKNLSEKLVVTLILFPVIVVVLFTSGMSFIGFFYLLFIILISFSLSFTFSFIVGLACFWIEDFWAIHNVKFVLVQFLGGIVLPYSFFPDKLFNLVRYSPFPYLANISVKFIQHKFILTDLLILSLWLFVFLFIARLLLHKSITKYSYVGG